MNPPLYPLENITADVHLLFSDNDWISNQIDVHRLCNRLHSCKEKLISAGSYSHLDYTFAKDALEDVYHHIMKQMNKIVKKPS